MRAQRLPDGSYRVLRGETRPKVQRESSHLSPDRLVVCAKRPPAPSPHTHLHCPLREAQRCSGSALPYRVPNSGGFNFVNSCVNDATAHPDVLSDRSQPLSPLLVIMRVAESRLLKKESSVITADDIFTMPLPHKPRLSIQLNFRPLDIEEGEKEPETPMAPTTPQLPEPLPTIKIKSEPPSSTEMLDSKQAGELRRSQDSRRASWLTSPSYSSSSLLPTYTPCQGDLSDGELRLSDPPGEVDTQNDCKDPPEQSPNDISHQF